MMQELAYLSFVDAFRLVMGVVLVLFVGFCVVYMRRQALNTEQIMINADLDRRERQQVIADLAEKTRKTLEANVEAQRSRDEILAGLHTKIDHTNALTEESTRSSKDALTAANSLNEKIQATQERLLDVAKGKTVVTIFDDVKKDKEP